MLQRKCENLTKTFTFQQGLCHLPHFKLLGRDQSKKSPCMMGTVTLFENQSLQYKMRTYQYCSFDKIQTTMKKVVKCSIQIQLLVGLRCADPEILALCKSFLATFDEHFKEPMTTVQHLRLMCYKLNKSPYQSVPFDK